MALCFGGDWDESLEDDDICLNISSAMRESLEDNSYEKERTTMIIKAEEACKNCEKEIKKIHKAVDKCIEDFIMPSIQEKSKNNMLGHSFYTGDFTLYYHIEHKRFDYEHPTGIAFCQRLIQKLEDYGYIVEQNGSIIHVYWYKYQEDDNVNNS